MKHPIDLLPIPLPLEDKNAPDDDYFYNNVIIPILPYIMEMESNGIPIDLEEVKKLETKAKEVLNNVKIKLAENNVIQDFLKVISEDYRNNADIPIKSKDNFTIKFNRSNIIHRTFIINSYLKDIEKESDCLNRWTITDIKKYANMTGSIFMEDIAKGTYNPDTLSRISGYMLKMADYKAKIYNDKIKKKIEDKAKEISFNPASTKQKQMLFSYLGIESEDTTDKGKDKWDREQLEILKKKLEMEIEDENIQKM